MFGHRIVGITKDSPAEKAGILKGDTLLRINGEPVQDVFDYHFLAEDIRVSLTIRRADGKEEEIQIRTAMSSHWMTLGKFKVEPKPEPDPDVKVIRSYIRGDGKQVDILSDGTTRLTEPERFGGFILQ